MSVSETFGPEHRPIVEFAIDNVQTLKLRKAKQLGRQQLANEDVGDLEQNDDSNTQNTHVDPKVSRKRKSKADNMSTKHANSNANVVENMESDKAGPEVSKNTKRRKSNPDGENSKEISSKKKSATYIQKKIFGKDTSKPDAKVDQATIGARDSKSFGELGKHSRKRISQELTGKPGEKNMEKNKRRQKNKDPLGRDAVDKLDMLIEQYRSKFTQKSSDKTNGEKQESRQLKRWFQS